jgi:AraC-like DNA-binding protein
VELLADTGSLPPAERFAYWAETTARVMEPIAVTQLAGGPFSGRLERHMLGPVELLHLRADASAAERTPTLIRADDPTRFQLMLQLRGRCAISQEDRSSVAQPGDLISWHSSKPYRIAGETAFESLMAVCNVDLLRPHIDRMCRRTAERVEGTGGTGAIVRQYLLGLLQGLHTGALTEASRLHLAEGLLDLVRAMYLQHEAPGRAAPRSSEALRLQIAAYIDEHLGDPGLTPASVARRHFISPSYLHRLFADEGASVGATIRAARLERARRDLGDPTLAGEPIFDVAARWGFVSKSHFSRSFKEAYGRSPSEFRRDALPA